MTITDQANYTDHQPRWKQITVNGNTCHVVAGCTACDWAKPPSDDSVASFGAHLEALGAPDYMVTYWNDWAGHVEAPDGALSRDAVARELSDYGVVMEQASLAYDDLTGGALSKPNTAAGHVVSFAERRFNATQADMILCDLLPLMDSPAARQAVIDYAETLHEGAYEEFQQVQAQRAEVPA